jgi:hypothetical protein
MGLFGKKCFLCSKKVGLLGGNKIEDLQTHSEIDFDHVPKNMGKDDQICNTCADNQRLQNSDLIVNWEFENNNPLKLRENIQKDDLFKKVFEKYSAEHPEKINAFNPKIRELNNSLDLMDSQIKSFQEQYSKTKGKMNYKKGFNFVSNPSLEAGVLRDAATAPYEQILIKLDTEIKQLEMQKLSISNELSNCSFNSQSEVEQQENSSPISSSPISSSPTSSSPTSSSPTSSSPISSSPTSSSPTGSNEEDPLKILKIRLVKGEITKEEFDELKDVL